MNIIKEADFRKEIKSDKLHGGYIFIGEEDYMKAFCLNAAKATISGDEIYDFFNYIKMSSMDFSASALLSAMAATPMMSEHKLIVIDDIDFNKLKSAQFNELCDVLSQLENYDSSILIISVSAGNINEGFLPKRPSTELSKLAEYLTVVCFESNTQAKLATWVQKHFEHNNVHADIDICSKLIEYSGKNMYSLSNETDKISYYVLFHGRNTVIESDIYNVSSITMEYGAFAFSNSIMDGNTKLALDILGDMKRNKIEPVNILGEISRVYTEMYSTKKLHNSGCSNAEIAKILKVHEYKVSLELRAVYNISTEKLENIIEKCAAADIALKLSTQGYIAIERLVCSF